MKYLLICLLVGNCLIAQEEVLKNPLLKHASISITMIDMETGRETFSYDPDRSLIPASTLKLLTGIPALACLGAEYRFMTQIAYSGKIQKDGTLEGDLYIIGSGDPCLGSNRIDGNPNSDALFSLLANKINRSITCIDGNIVIMGYDQEDHFPVSQDWLFEDVGNYYGAGLWPININENQYKVYFDRSANIGEKTRLVSVEPSINGLSHSNMVVVGKEGSGDQSYILGTPYQYRRQIVGSLPRGRSLYSIKGAMPDPPRYFAKRLSQELDQRGVSFQSCKVERLNEEMHKVETLFRIKSPRLIDIVKSIHLESNNLYTEAVAKLLDTSTKEIEKSLGKGARISDACGLSPMNRMSSRQMAHYLSKQNIQASSLLATLPRVAYTGTLKNMLTSSPAKGRIYAKSGSMSGVLCYAGYMEKEGRWFSFSLMLNNFDGKIKDIKPVAASLLEALYLK